ncbi:MAG: carboxyl transferase domain-containing protein, partial [Streptosporangiaceae bacterium]
HQKIIEEAPSPSVDDRLRSELGEAALRAARAIGYVNAGTVEFLLLQDGTFAFLEINTRLQVEHTVTECVTGLDLVRLQLLVADGLPLPREVFDASISGHAIEVRLYAEDPTESWQPSAGQLHRFRGFGVSAFGASAFGAPVSGDASEPAAVRVDSGVEDGSMITTYYDPLLAKVIAYARTRREAARVLSRTLELSQIHGLRTNRDLLVRILRHPEFLEGHFDTGFLERHDPAVLGAPLATPEAERLHSVAAALSAQADRRLRASVLAHMPSGWRNVPGPLQRCSLEGRNGSIELGYRFDSSGKLDVVEIDGQPRDDLSLVSCTPEEVVLASGSAELRYSVHRVGTDVFVDGPDGFSAFTEVERFPVPGSQLQVGALVAPLPGTVVNVRVEVGTPVKAGDTLVAIEAMKMEHEVRAQVAGLVREVAAAVGATVAAGEVLVVLAGSGAGAGEQVSADDVPLDHVRPDLEEVRERHRTGLDEGRPAVTERRHAAGRRTARENIADLADPGSFTEYGALTIAAQRRRRPLDDLIARTPADGLILGTATVDGRPIAVMSYDYSVLAGTQGHMNHRKTDRLLELADRERLPLVMFAEGGGGRPGDTDTTSVAGLDVPTFRLTARLSGRVPLVAIVSGYCFAGNAALAGACDVIIATPAASRGRGGPAMIEGGGLGVVAPDAVGPMSVQVPNGVVDLLVPDEPAAVAAARRYLSYFRPRTVPTPGPALGAPAEHADQRVLRHLIPENRVRSYDVRPVIEALCDTGSVLELRAGFGVGVITVLARLGGHAAGLLVNNPRHLGGAIDGDAADKATAFLRLCEAHRLPVVSLVDTPGFMVGPEAERTAIVRRFGAMFVAGARLTVPVCAVVLRKAYGLGAMAMTAGDLRRPAITVAWPTGEFGGMGLEGAVRLGYRKELEAIEDPAGRRARYEELVAEQYARGKAVSTAMAFEIDDVIDPADTRAVLAGVLARAAAGG